MTKPFITSGTAPSSGAAALADSIANLHSLVEGLPAAIAEAVAEGLKASGLTANQATGSTFPAFRVRAGGGQFLAPKDED